MWHTVLGAFEAGFAASLIFYLTTFYTRGELGKVRGHCSFD